MPAVRTVRLSEEWDDLDVEVLRPARSGAVCITCQHFRDEVGNHCLTVLTCPIHQSGIRNGENLTKRWFQCVLGGTFRLVGAQRGGRGLEGGFKGSAPLQIPRRMPFRCIRSQKKMRSSVRPQASSSGPHLDRIQSKKTCAIAQSS